MITPKHRQVWNEIVKLSKNNYYKSVNVKTAKRAGVIQAVDEYIKWLEERLEHLRQIEEAEIRLKNVLKELIEFNPLRNDRDAYLLALSEWALDGKWGEYEEFSERPQRADFGLE